MRKNTFLLILILALAAILRIWRLDSVPVSLFGDELDVGYQAYSILKTGKDYTGNIALFYVNSIADKKAPLYSYLIAPSVATFGISPLGVRLPAALFGLLGILFFYLLVELWTKNKNTALLGAFLLTVSPWDIQYSRWGFEGTLMLFLFLAGLYSFLRSFTHNKFIVISALFFSLALYAYHAAKVFIPLVLVVMVIIWWKQIWGIPKKFLIVAFVVLVILVGPLMTNSFFGTSAERFGSLSIFNDPKNVGEIGFDRVRDEKMNTEYSRLFHNKATLLFSKIANNYLESFSTQFLFIRGDTNPRHSILQNGEFYKYQFFLLIAGLISFAIKPIDKKFKVLIATWVILAPLPSMITVSGGNHASRLLFLLPPLIFFVALGVYNSYFYLGRNLRKIYILILSITFVASFIFYQHNFWVHYPWDSEKWWQAGFKEAIQSVVSESKNYDNVIISQADEPALIFFLGWSQYPPAEFQQKYPLAKEQLAGIGEVSRLDKYYFPPIGKERGLYELGTILPKNTLYLATTKEIKLDLIKEPQRVPSDLILIKSITYPSGDPAFYLFQKAI